MPGGANPRSETTLSQAVMGELRAELARRRVGSTWLAPHIGRSYNFTQKALQGTGYLVLDDIARACDALDLPLETLLRRAREAMALEPVAS